MLHEQGYEVVGIALWRHGITPPVWAPPVKGNQLLQPRQFQWCPPGCGRSWFPHFILDIREEFGDFVIENFVEEYLAGRTQSPVWCVIRTSNGRHCWKGPMRLIANSLPQATTPRFTSMKTAAFYPQRNRWNQGSKLCALGAPARPAKTYAPASLALFIKRNPPDGAWLRIPWTGQKERKLWICFDLDTTMITETETQSWRPGGKRWLVEIL